MTSYEIARNRWVPDTAVILTEADSGYGSRTIMFTHAGELRVIRIFQVRGAWHVSVDYTQKLTKILQDDVRSRQADPDDWLKATKEHPEYLHEEDR